MTAQTALGGTPPAVVDQAPLIKQNGKTVEIRTASVAMVAPAAIWNGRLAHPSDVIRQRAGWRRTKFYRVMLEQNLRLSSDCAQWEDRVNANDLLIRPGDPDEEISRQMARDAKSYVERLPNIHAINTWMVRPRWYGFTSFGVAGWRKDDATGLLLPFDIYNIDPWLWEFGPNFEPYLITQNGFVSSRFDASGRPWEESVFFCRWGSNYTGYGQSDLDDVYLDCWTIEKVTEILLESIQRLSQPIVWIEVGSAFEGKEEKEFDEFEAGVKRQYGEHYVILKTPDAPNNVTIPNLNVLANSAVGGSELGYLRYLDGRIQSRIHGTQQTQDQTSGSRSLETERLGVAGDKTPPGLQVRDQGWNLGVLARIGAVNYPNQPRQLWPVADCAAADAERLTGPQIIALRAVEEDIRLNNTTPEWAMATLELAGFRSRRAEKMVESMFSKFGGVTSSPVSLDGFRMQQVMEAFNRLVAGADTDEVTEMLVKAAGVPIEWAISAVKSTRANIAKLKPLVTKGQPATADPNGAAAAEARQMSETLKLMEAVA